MWCLHCGSLFLMPVIQSNLFISSCFIRLKNRLYPLSCFLSWPQLSWFYSWTPTHQLDDLWILQGPLTREFFSHFAYFNQLQVFWLHPPQTLRSNTNLMLPLLDPSISNSSAGFHFKLQFRTKKKSNKKNQYQTNQPQSGLHPPLSQSTKTLILPSATWKG